jgi:glycosyltransferase involved in cell wall biosynthesis
MSDRHLLCLYPWLALGGADRFNLDMLSCLISRGWRATIVTTRPSTHQWRADFEQLTDDIIDLTFFPPEQYPAQLLRIIEVRPLDCVLISHSSEGYGLLPYLRAHRPDLPYIDYCHMVGIDRRNGGYPHMSLAYAQALDLQIVSSDYLRQWMCARGGERDRIAVCTTNVDWLHCDPARYNRAALRAQLQIAPAAPVVLYAARLERQKQPMLALRVMKQVAAHISDACFLVAGDGSFASCMRGFLSWHGLEPRVRMLGAVSNQRIRELLALSDVLFLPSEGEGISLAIYEAMALEVVPVGAAVGGQPELVTPECGVLVQPGPHSYQAYTEALLRLLQEPDLTRRMGCAARKRVIAHFGLDTMGMRMHELLIEAQALHQTRPRPRITAAAANAAARDSIIAAGRHKRKRTRHRLRALYWGLADRGAWWVLPIVEQARRSVARLLSLL